MPGICGIACSTPTLNDGDLLERMIGRLTHHEWYDAGRLVVPSGDIALGRVSLGFNPLERPESNGERAGVMDGELYLDTRSPGQDKPARTETQIQLLLRGFASSGQSFLRSLEGKFSAAIWDGPHRRLVLTNDRFGMKPLYYCHLPGKLLFASEIKALLAEPSVSRRTSKRGLAEFLTFGHLLGETTLFDGVYILPPAAWLVYDARADRVTVDRYWRLAEVMRQTEGGEQQSADQVCDALQRAVDRRVQETQGLGISLSGGLDGRTILAAIDTRQTPLKSVCMGMAGSLDHRSAEQLARLAGCSHHTYILDTAFLARFEQHMRYMVHLTDGQYLDQCIVLPTLPLYRQLGIQFLLRGHAGELLHMDKAYNFSLDNEALAIHTEEELSRWLNSRLCAYMLQGVEGPLVAGEDQASIQALARESLQRCLAESAEVRPQLQRVAHLFITQRQRRETAMSLAMFNSVVETRVPFLDTELVQALMALPPTSRLGDRLQSEFLRRQPEFLQVVNSNTGAPMGAGPLRRKAATFRMKVLGKLGVPGYQPYERLGLWLRRELKPLVRQILLSQRCLDRGLFTADVVRSVVHRHLEGGHNHTYLLMALMILELGQREFVDGDAAERPLDCSPSAASSPIM